RPCRVRSDGHDSSVHEGECQRADRTPRGGICFGVPAARVRHCRHGARSWQRPAEPAGAMDVRSHDGTSDADRRTLDAGIPGDPYVAVAQIARQFGSGYRLTVSRLLGQGVIAEADSTRLLKPRLVELAGEWVTLFSARAATPHPAYPLWVLSDLSSTRA